MMKFHLELYEHHSSLVTPQLGIPANTAVGRLLLLYYPLLSSQTRVPFCNIR